MTTLDDLLDAGTARHRAAEASRKAAGALAAGLWGVGWLLAKLIHLLLLTVGGFFYAVGWVGRRAVWPAILWCGAAVRLGWQDARRRGGADR